MNGRSSIPTIPGIKGRATGLARVVQLAATSIVALWGAPSLYGRFLLHRDQLGHGSSRASSTTAGMEALGRADASPRAARRIHKHIVTHHIQRTVGEVFLVQIVTRKPNVWAKNAESQNLYGIHPIIRLPLDGTTMVALREVSGARTQSSLCRGDEQSDDIHERSGHVNIPSPSSLYPSEVAKPSQGVFENRSATEATQASSILQRYSLRHDTILQIDIDFMPDLSKSIP